MLYKYGNAYPKIGKNCFIAPSADIIGNVEIGENSSVWFHATLRGDMNKIEIGRNVNIQDNCIIHTEIDSTAEIGDHVSVGHNAIVHSARIGSYCIIGMSAVILSGAQIGQNCILGAGTVVTEGTIIPANSVILGVPARVVRQVTPEHLERIRKNLEAYSALATDYLKKGNFEKL